MSTNQEALDRERREFFENIQVPIDEDWETNGSDFVNPIVVADMFAASTSISAKLAQEAEVISEKMAKLEYEKAKAEKAIYKLRRVILADNYGKITKSASGEIQDAFIVSVATTEQKQGLVELEAERDDKEDKIGRLVPRLEKIKFRMKVLEKNMEWARQFLDYDKLMTRIHSTGRA